MNPGDTSPSIIAVKFGLSDAVTNESVARHLGDSVQGESVLVSEEGEELCEFVDVDRVRKVYKLDSGGGGGGGGGKGGGKKGKGKGTEAATLNGTGGVDERKEMEAVVLGMMTIKGL